MVLSAVVVFLAMAVLTPMAMAQEKSTHTPMGSSKMEKQGSMPGRVFESERGALAMGSLLSAGYVVVNSYAVCPSTGKSGFRTFNMFGVPVRNPKGEFLGSAAGLLLNNRNYDDAFAVINVGSSHGDGGKGRFIAVPMTALKISETESGKLDIMLNSTESKLEAAPLFDGSKMDNPQYEIHLYRYYGLQPYWAEECVVPGM